MFEPETVIAGFQDVTVMGEPIKQCRGHLGVTKHRGSFSKAQIGGDDQAGFLIQLADQMEQQCTTRLAEW